MLIIMSINTDSKFMPDPFIDIHWLWRL